MPNRRELNPSWFGMLTIYPLPNLPLYSATLRPFLAETYPFFLASWCRYIFPSAQSLLILFSVMVRFSFHFKLVIRFNMVRCILQNRTGTHFTMCKPMAHLLNWLSLHHHTKRKEEHNNMLLLPDIVCSVHTLSLRASITDKSKRYSILSLCGWFARSAFWVFWSYGTLHGCISCHIRPPIVSSMHSSCIECLLCPVIGNKGTAYILVLPCGSCR